MEAEVAAVALGNNDRNNNGRPQGTPHQESEAVQRMTALQQAPKLWGGIAWIVVFVIVVAVIVGVEKTSKVSGNDSAGVMSRRIQTSSEGYRELLAEVKARQADQKGQTRIQSPDLTDEPEKEYSLNDGLAINDLYLAAKVFHSKSGANRQYEKEVVYGKVLVNEIGWHYDSGGLINELQDDIEGNPSSSATVPIKAIKACAADCTKYVKRSNKKQLDNEGRSDKRFHGHISAIRKKHAPTGDLKGSIRKHRKMHKGLARACDRFFHDDKETRDSCRTLVANYLCKKEINAKKQGQEKNQQPAMFSHAFSLVCKVVLAFLLAKLVG